MTDAKCGNMGFGLISQGLISDLWFSGPTCDFSDNHSAPNFSTEGNFREFYARTLCTRKLRALLKIGETNTKKVKFQSFLFSIRNFSLTILNNMTTCHFNLKLESIHKEQFLQSRRLI